MNKCLTALSVIGYHVEWDRLDVLTRRLTFLAISGDNSFKTKRSQCPSAKSISSKDASQKDQFFIIFRNVIGAVFRDHSAD